MKPETCNLCEDTICVSRPNGRYVIKNYGRRWLELEPIDRCLVRQTVLENERIDLVDLCEAHGNTPPTLLGC